MVPPTHWYELCTLLYKKRGVSHYGLAIHITKYLKEAKEELWKLKYFTMQKYNLQKKKIL
jgi:hypothetical protein